MDGTDGFVLRDGRALADYFAPPNRITRAIELAAARIDALDSETRATLDRELDLDPREHFAWQTAKSRAHLEGRLSTDEAQLFYVALGESCSGSNGGWASGVTLAEKVALTLAMGAILKGAR